MRTTVVEARGISIATWLRMLRDRGSLAVLAGVMTGCASLSSPPPPTTSEAECLRNNGAWRAVLNYCEHGR